MVDVIGVSPAVFNYLTVPLFQANAATGTITYPDHLNDDDNDTIAFADTDENGETDLGKKFWFKQFRMSF